MKILYYGESYFINTGLGKVSKYHIDLMLSLGHKVTMIAANQNRDVPSRFKVHVAPDNELLNIEQAKHLIETEEYDLLFISRDLGEIYQFYNSIFMRKSEKAKVVFYTCCDSDMITEASISYLGIADMVITYSKHSTSVLEKHGIPAFSIPIGCEPEIFYPLPDIERKEARKRAFNVSEDTFVIISTNRNQPRKDLARTLDIFNDFQSYVPNSKLYMHCKRKDIGGNILSYAEMLGVNPKSLILTPENFGNPYGVSREELNMLYNAADCYISTSTGEGWGICTTEAMAAGTPVCVPDNTSHPEIVGTQGERGLLAPCDNWTVQYGVGAIPRPIVCNGSMINCLYDVVTGNYRKSMIQNAREWTIQNSWIEILRMWEALFTHELH